MRGASKRLIDRGLLIGLALMGTSLCASAQQDADGSSESGLQKMADIPYAVVDGHELKLDLYLPADVSRPPLLVWVHGGAWQAGSKDPAPTTPFVDAGYALASVQYRLSGVAQFPAPIHDIKAAIRFLRASAASYGYDAGAIGVMGASAGGHLAALVGTTNGHAELEGTVGNNLDESSDIDVIISYFGAYDFTTVLEQSTPEGGAFLQSAVFEKLLGGDSPQSDMARLASPVAHVDDADPPMLVLHGNQDVDIPMQQSGQVADAYEEHGVEIQFHVIDGAGHGGDQFFDAERNRLVVGFLEKQIQPGS